MIYYYVKEDTNLFNFELNICKNRQSNMQHQLGALLHVQSLCYIV